MFRGHDFISKPHELFIKSLYGFSQILRRLVSRKTEKSDQRKKWVKVSFITFLFPG